MRTLYYTLDSTQTAGGGQAILNQLRSEGTNTRTALLSCPPGDLAETAAEYATYLPMRKTSPLGRILELYLHVKRYQPDTIHIHTISALPIGIVATLFSKITRIYTEHLQTAEYHLENKTRDLVQKTVFRFLTIFISRIYAVSNAVKEYLTKSLHIKSDKITVRYNPVPDYEEQVTHSIHTPMRILSIGTINNVKNFSELIDIAVLLRKRKVNFKLEIIGDGPLLEELTAKVRKFMIEDIVVLSGWKAHEEVMYSLLRSDIYVQTSKSESFCYTITEAMAVGLPVVAYRVGGIPEVITDEQSGYLIDFGDIEAFANAVTMLAKNVEIRERFGAFGRDSLSRFR